MPARSFRNAAGLLFGSILVFFLVNRSVAQTDPVTDFSGHLQQITQQTVPAVVKILATGYVPSGGHDPGDNLLSKQRALGSGVIVDPDGFIVTNMHVLEGARRVRVLLSVGSGENEDLKSILKPRGKTLDALIVGLDRETDIAVLKIQETGLPYLEFGDSDLLEKGQLVLAIGSPLGLENSVAMGVVSSKARQLAPDHPMIYIQTDASINPGNSGGPLINTKGQVIGINTLIFSQSGGSEGIGFAAPSNIVAYVYNQIREKGYVQRGEIGVDAQTITPLLAAGLGLPRDWGVVLGDVRPDGPADKAGLDIGDMVLSMDGKVMENARQFDVNVYQRNVGEKIVIEILRGEEQKTVEVPVNNRPYDRFRLNEMVDPKTNLVPKLGILGLDLDKNIRKYLPPLRKDLGVVVALSSTYSTSGEGGLESGDVIYSVNRYPITGLNGLKSRVESLGPGDPLVLQVERFGKLMYVPFELD